MKKKGLLISTIAMVVVLIAALTTTTYAWFTAASKTEVRPINFEVTSDSDLTIGVSKTNKINTGDSIGQNLFVSGSGLSYDITKNAWDGTEGLGFEVDTGLSLAGMKKAVYTGTAYVAGNDSSGTIDETLQPEGNWVKASGSGQDVTRTEIENAVANGIKGEDNTGDYLDVAFGVAPAKQNVTKVKCVIGVNPDSSSTVLGMNAAISFIYKIDNGSWSDIIDVYEGHSATTTINGTTNYTPIEIPDITWNPGAKTYEIEITGNGTDIVPQGEIHQIHIKLFINGKDQDCNSNAANVKSVITINFIADKKAESST